MLDVITGGRIISGMVVGTGKEYFSYNINPTYARERFHEAHDLILKAWTTEAVRLGGHALPLPLRQRLAEAVSAAASADLDPRLRQPETIEWVAQQRYTYMVLPTLAPYELRRQAAEYFRDAASAGYTARHDRSAGASASTSARPTKQARREYEPHFWYYARNLLKNRAAFSLAARAFLGCRA